MGAQLASHLHGAKQWSDKLRREEGRERWKEGEREGGREGVREILVREIGGRERGRKIEGG